MRKDRSSKSTRENWLLIKQRDAAASEKVDPVEAWQRSVVSRRSMAGIAKAQGRER
jgi:hypothetical protein